MLQLLLCFNLLPSISAIFSFDSLVVQLTGQNFDKLVLRSERVWFVKFYAPWCGHCQEFAAEFDRAATALKGVVRLGAVNVDEEKNLADQYGIDSYPTVKLFIVDKMKPEEFRGERNANTLTNAAMSAVQRKVNHQLSGKPDAGPRGNFKDVIKLTDNNFQDLVLNSNDMWMINFYVPWCQTCQRFEPVWADAATELKDKVRFGAVDVTINRLTADRYKIEKYPTIKYFPAGFKKDILEYTLQRYKNEIVEFAMKTFLNSKPAKKVRQIINNNTFEKVCAREQLCVISFLPNLMDCRSECRLSYLKILKTISEKFKDKFWGWFWSEAAVQVKFEDTLNIGGFGYPAMVVLNMKKMRYTTLRGSFSEEGIGNFLRDLSYGHGNVNDLNGKIEILDVEAWDEADSKLPKEYQEEKLIIEEVIVKSKKEIDEESEYKGKLKEDHVKNIVSQIEIGEGNYNEKIGESKKQSGSKQKIKSEETRDINQSISEEDTDGRTTCGKYEKCENLSLKNTPKKKPLTKAKKIIEQGGRQCNMESKEDDESENDENSSCEKKTEREDLPQVKRSEVSIKKLKKTTGDDKEKEVCSVGKENNCIDQKNEKN